MRNKIYPVSVLKTSYIKNIIKGLKKIHGLDLVHKTVYDRIEKELDRELSLNEKRIIQAHCGITKEFVKMAICGLIRSKMSITQYSVFMEIKTKYVAMSNQLGVENKYSGLYYKLDKKEKQIIKDEVMNFYKLNKRLVMLELITDAVKELNVNDESIHITKIRLIIEDRMNKKLNEEERRMITDYYIKKHNSKM